MYTQKYTNAHTYNKYTYTRRDIHTHFHIFTYSTYSTYKCTLKPTHIHTHIHKNIYKHKHT